MRILKLSTAYPLYLEKFYARRQGLASASYANQKTQLDYDAFGWADFWSHALAPLGYETADVLANNAHLQRAWSVEHGVPFSENSWLLDVAHEQIKRFRPDIIFVHDYTTFRRDWLNELRHAVPSIRLIIGWCGAPFRDPDVFNAYDIVLSCIPELVEQFSHMGHRSLHFNHAFETRILDRVHERETPRIPFSFVGQIVRANQFHTERERLLESLSAATPIQIFSTGGEITRSQQLKALLAPSLYDLSSRLHDLGVSDAQLRRMPIVGRARTWSERPRAQLVSPKLRRHMRPSVFGLDMFQTLKDSEATFNSHIDISPHSASNMRLFEATGVGTCLVTDWKENLGKLFEPDREVITYRSAEECIEKMRWLSDHPQERQAIARAGQERTLKDHTFVQRAAQLNEIIVAALR